MTKLGKQIEVWNGGEYGEDPECKCGNTPHLDGFYPATLDGELVEPDHNWKNGIYACGKCGLVGIITEGQK